MHSDRLNRNDFGWQFCSSFAVANQRQAALVVLVIGHTIQALKALVVINFAHRRDGLVAAAVAAGLAGCAALGAAWNPLPKPQFAHDRHSRTQRAYVTAVAAKHQQT